MAGRTNQEWITPQVVEGIEAMFGADVCSRRLLSGITPDFEAVVTARAQYAVCVRLRQELERRLKSIPQGTNVVQCENPGPAGSA